MGGIPADDSKVKTDDEGRLELNDIKPNFGVEMDGLEEPEKPMDRAQATLVTPFTNHCHPQHSEHRDKSAERILGFVCILTLVFIVGEVVGGYLAHSLAIMTDAAHMLSDLASFLISLFAIWVARKPATKTMSFGFYRAEVLGALCSIMIIWVLTGVLVFMAVKRVIYEDYAIHSKPMLITAAGGLLFNIIMGLVLGGHGHSHGRSPPPEETWNVNKRKHRNINVRAAFVHIIGDLVQSIGVLIAALIIYFKPEYKLADPICTFLFSVLILMTTLTVLRDAIQVLMEGTPRDVQYSEVKADLEAIEGVQAAHSLQIWSLTMDKVALAVHLAIGEAVDPLTVMSKASWMLRFKYNLSFTTIQVEPYDSVVMTMCTYCIEPS